MMQSAGDDGEAAPPIAAIFLVVFDKKVGYKITWEQRIPEVDLSGVDFKSLPSGLHNVEQDLVYFTHGDYAGISAFSNKPGSEADRNANFLTVGVLVSLSYGRLGRSWMHAKALRELSADYITSGDGQGHAKLEGYWERYKLSAAGEQVRPPALVEPSTPAPELSQGPASHKRRSRALSDVAGFSARDHRLSTDHPALSMPDLLDTFGPLIFPLYKAALLRKRILFLGSVPIQRSCNFVYDLSIFANVPSSLDSTLPSPPSMNRIRPLFNVGIHDIPELSAKEHNDPGASGEGWIACTTDDILATKKTLFDVLVELPISSKADQWPKLTTSDGTIIRATQRDLRRYTSLRKELARMGRMQTQHGSSIDDFEEDLDGSEDGSPLLRGSMPGALSADADLGIESEASIIEPSSWTSIAYTSFLWWAAAGERMITQDDETYQDLSLLDDLVSTTSASTTSLSHQGSSADVQQTQQTAMILIAYFHRLTAMMLGEIGSIINSDEDASVARHDDDDNDSDAEHRRGNDAVIELSADELSRIGLDVWSASDAVFVADLAWESYFTYGTDESPVDHDIHFRPGIGANGQETFAPRVLIYDLKDSFGTLRRENALYQAEEEQHQASQISQWSGAAQPLTQPAIPESSYQAALNASHDLPDLTTADVRYWSDYNHVFYHPRSLQPISTLSLTDSLAPFERFGAGEEVYRLLDSEHGLIDRDLRPWLEECDLLQAVQLNTNVDDAWGGFAAKFNEAIRDEIGKTSIWVTGIEQGDRSGRDLQNLKMANVVQALDSLTEFATLYVPVTSMQRALPSYVQDYDQASRWHTSALQVSALESITLPCRLRESEAGACKSTELESTLLNDGKRKLVHLGLSVSPEDSGSNGTVPHMNGTHDSRMPAVSNGHGGQQGNDEFAALELDANFTPEVLGDNTSSTRGRPSPTTADKIFAQFQSLRGVFRANLEIEAINDDSRNRFSSTADAGVRVSCHQSKLLYPMLSSHPRIYRFEDSIQRLDKVKVQATLTASSAVAIRLRALERRSRTLMGVEEREALSESLLTMAEEYVHGWEDSSDDED